MALGPRSSWIISSAQLDVSGGDRTFFLRPEAGAVVGPPRLFNASEDPVLSAFFDSDPTGILRVLDVTGAVVPTILLELQDGGLILEIHRDGGRDPMHFDFGEEGIFLPSLRITALQIQSANTPINIAVVWRFDE